MNRGADEQMNKRTDEQMNQEPKKFQNSNLKYAPIKGNPLMFDV